MSRNAVPGLIKVLLGRGHLRGRLAVPGSLGQAGVVDLPWHGSRVVWTEPLCWQCRLDREGSAMLRPAGLTAVSKRLRRKASSNCSRIFSFLTALDFKIECMCLG